MTRDMRVALTAVVMLVAGAATTEAQWLTLRTPGIPRLPDGTPNLNAPAPRTADGKPDFSGIWRTPTGDALHIIERFRRIDFGHMDVQIMIDDPKAYLKPWELFPDTELLDWVCENNKYLDVIPK